MPASQKPPALPKIDEGQVLVQAVSLHKAGQLKEAKNLYRLILTQNPRHADALHRLGTIALQVEQFEKAADYIGQAIVIGPATATMHINHGAALRQAEKYDEALAAYKKAIELEPENSDAYFNQGRAFQQKNNLMKQ